MNKHLYDKFSNWYQGGQIFFYSDPHFNDPESQYFRVNYVGDDEQVRRINYKVGKNDTIVFLGDIGDTNFVRKIKGYKVLIKGNHDSGSANYQKQFTRRFICRDYKGDREACEKDFLANGGCIEDLGECEFCDLAHSEFLNNRLFDEVYEGPLFISDKILLSHEPILLPYAINIHGHVHNQTSLAPNELNMCAELINYTPISFKQIVESGILGSIDSLHRNTIDTATERKKNGKK